jgi:hypothetical protein
VGVGVQRKPGSPMGYAFGRILGMNGEPSPTLSLSGLGTGLVFGFDMMFGVGVNLKSLFLELYVIACDKEALVLDYLESSSSSFHWNPSFIRAVQVWELESLDSFPSVLLL